MIKKQFNFLLEGKLVTTYGTSYEEALKEAQEVLEDLKRIPQEE